MEFFKIAWRNLGRNLRRTVVITCAIALGVWGALMAMGLFNSFAYQMMDNFIYADLGQIEIHKQGYLKNPGLRLAITDAQMVADKIKRVPHLAGYSPRVISFALAQSPRASQGVMLLGIDPRLEPGVTRIKKFIIKGSFFAADDEPAVLIGKDLANKLNVAVGDKLAFFTQNFSSEEDVVESFRIKGIFSSGIAAMDKGVVYLPLKRAERIMDMQGRLDEIVVVVDHWENLNAVKEGLKQSLSGIKPDLKFERAMEKPEGREAQTLKFRAGKADAMILAPEAIGESFKLNPATDGVSFRLALPVVAMRPNAERQRLTLWGVEPVNENQVSGLFDRVEIPKTSWLQGTEMDKELEANHDWVILGRNAAAALNAQAGDTIRFESGGQVLALQVAGVLAEGPDQHSRGLFAVTGRGELWRAFLQESAASEVVVRLRENADAQKTGEALLAGLGLEVLDWRELVPMIAQYSDIMAVFNVVLLLCIYIVVAFGIANTMIMSVFERVREFGILRAMGTRPGQIFSMVIIESIMLALVGMVVGGLASAATYWVWARYGLDLSMFAKGLQTFGMPTMVYPVLNFHNILLAVIMAFVIAVISALYPAVHASHLLVVEALRRI